jgi:inner membrane protein
MPSPIGHALAGAAIAWGFRGTTGWKLPALCALFAMLPDLDLVYRPLHRTATHSIPVGILLTIVAIAVTGQVKAVSEWCRSNLGAGSEQASTGVGVRSDRSRIGLACGLAWTSHVLLDWLGADASAPYGLQALWPVSDIWYFSGLDLFPGTERREPFTARAIAINLRAALQEIVLVGPIAAGAWWLTRIRKNRARTSGPGGLPPPSAGAVDTAGTSDRPARPAGH